MPQKLQWNLGDEISVINKLAYNNTRQYEVNPVGDLKITGEFKIIKAVSSSKIKLVVVDGSMKITLVLPRSTRPYVEVLGKEGKTECCNSRLPPGRFVVPV